MYDNNNRDYIYIDIYTFIRETQLNRATGESISQINWVKISEEFQDGITVCLGNFRLIGSNTLEQK